MKGKKGDGHHHGHKDEYAKGGRASCKGYAKGGRTEMKVSGNPDVFKEAEEEHKHGGKVGHKKPGHHMKHLGHPEGHKAKHRMDRPHRKAGGRVGSDKSPLSSAHHGGSAGEREHGQPD